MKKISKEIISCIIIFSIIICGLFYGNVSEILDAGIEDCKNYMQDNGLFLTVPRFTWKVETAFSEGLSYHKDFMDFNSAIQNNMGTVLIDKGDTTVVKSKTGFLSYLRDKMPEISLMKRARNVAKLQYAAEENGAEFLYVLAPVKGYNMEFAENIEDFNKENCDLFMEELDKVGVPNYSLIEAMEEDGISEEEMFFITDHHWKPEYALWAAEKICQEFQSRYGFEYDESKLNIDNYNITEYENWFLGSQGKKTGQYFTELGVDNFNLLTPNFETNFSDTQVGKDYYKEGSFEEILIHRDHIETKNFYTKNPYASYLGGDYREEILKNNMIENGKKVLVLRDSFSCAFAPFFALNIGETYLLDMRNFDEFAGKRIDVAKYIEKTKPDYVMIMYTGVTGDDIVYEFK